MFIFRRNKLRRNIKNYSDNISNNIKKFKLINKYYNSDNNNNNEIKH